MDSRRHNLVMTTLASIVASIMAAIAGVSLYWLFDRDPVVVFHSAVIDGQGPVVAGGTVGVKIDLTRPRECRGFVQYWLNGNTVITLGNLFLSRWEKGDREVFVSRFDLPRWLPPGEYQVRRTAWYECNPLNSQHIEMPPVPVTIEAADG